MNSTSNISFSAINLDNFSPRMLEITKTKTPTIPINGDSIFNQRWFLLSFEGLISISGSEPNVLFGIDGKFSGDTGCNTFQGSYEINQNFIKIIDLTSTNERCNEPLKTQETIFINALRQSQTFFINENRLRLNSPSGIMILSNRNPSEKLDNIPTQESTLPPEPTKQSTDPLQPSRTPISTLIPPATQISNRLVAIIDGPISGEAGSPIKFSGSRSKSDSKIVEYLWDFGDGIMGQGVHINYIYYYPGNYTVTLTITDNQKNNASTTLSINIK
jgi:heat shock protein HslJ